MMVHTKTIVLITLAFAVVLASTSSAEDTQPGENSDDDNNTQEEEDDADDKSEAPSAIHTEAPETTTSTNSPETTPQVATIVTPPDESFYVHDDSGKICIAVKIDDATFVFDYITKDGRNLTTTKSIGGEKNADMKSWGKCYGSNGSRLKIEWHKYCNLSMEFSRAENGRSWSLSHMELELDPAGFFETDDDEPVRILKAKPSCLDVFTAPIGNSLTCKDSKVVTFEVEDIPMAEMVWNNFKMQAFDVPTEFGEEGPCSGNDVSDVIEYRSDTAPIAVGLTFALLTLVAIIGFSIHRVLTQKKVDYNTM